MTRSIEGTHVAGLVRGLKSVTKASFTTYARCKQELNSDPKMYRRISFSISPN